MIDRETAEAMRQEVTDVLAPNGFAGFPSLREAQTKALLNVILCLEQGKNHILLDAPTGVGKSAIGAAMAKLSHKFLGWKSLYLPPSRALQNQLVKDLLVDPFFRMFQGQANYNCSMLERSEPISVARSPCQKDKNIVYLDHIGPNKPHQFATVHSDINKRVRAAAQDLAYLCGTGNEGDPFAGNEEALGRKLRRACQDTGACTYYASREAANAAECAIFNLQGFCFYQHLGIAEMLGYFLPRHVHIWDEAHNLDQNFRSVFTESFSEGELNKFYLEVLSQKEKPIDFAKIKPNPQDPSWTWGEAVTLVQAVMDLAQKGLQDIYLKEENRSRSVAGLAPIPDVFSYVQAVSKGSVAIRLDENDKHFEKLIAHYKIAAYAIRDYARYSKKSSEGNIYVNVTGDKINIFPIELTELTGKFMATNLNLYMTATVPKPEIFFKLIGVDSKDSAIIRVPDPFPVENHPIFIDTVETVTRNRALEVGMPLVSGETFNNEHQKKKAAEEAGNKEIYSRMADRFSEVLDTFPSQAGLGFVSSYVASRVLENVFRTNPRVLFVQDGESNRHVIQDYKKRAGDESLFLISAGIYEGHSFDDDLSRVQVVFKVPYPVFDEVTRVMDRRYPGYYDMQVAIKLQQMVGRSMRSQKDHCCTIVLDGKFAELMQKEKQRRLYRDTFLKSIQWKKDWRTVRFDSEKISY